MKNFQIYEKQSLSINTVDEGGEIKKNYIAIPHDEIKNGIFIPSSHPEISGDPVGEIEARNKDQAVEKYRDKRDNMMY